MEHVPATAHDQSYYLALGDGRYAPTHHVQGAWQEDEQHMAPVAGLLVHALERHEPRPDLLFSRVSFDILGKIHLGETVVTTRTLRPGRTIELVEATASAGGRDVVRATAWRLAAGDTAHVAAVEHEPMPAPGTWPAWDGMSHWGGGFIESLELFAGEDARPGRGRAWVRTAHPLVAGEETSGLARWCGLLDLANGLVCRKDPREWMFPNVDLTLHLHRQPTGLWTGLDTRVAWGPTGQGLTSTVVHDEAGPVGTVEQSLTLREIGAR